eukprot:CCRYP_009332-RA/>CCRYP_009332-RA protein AED:0.29 eAED:0.29 QI:0/0/0/1/1/1/2/0/133
MRWINGPQPVSVHNITLLRGGKQGKMHAWNRSALYFNVPVSVKRVGDLAKAGQPDKTTTTKDAHSPTNKRLFARMKSMLETCNGRLKNFKFVCEFFCHGQGTSNKPKKIKVAFESAAVLVQYDIENGHGIFEV